jgi:Ca2+-binding RTX toxin-like protein
VFQRAVGSFGRELCISYELDPGQLVCDSNHAPVQGPLAVGDLNGSAAGVPPDEVLTGGTGSQLGIFGFAPAFPLVWASSSSRSVSGGLESATFGDLDDDHDLDVLVGQAVNSLSSRVDSIHYFKWDPAGSGGLEQNAKTLPSTPGVDAVAVADVDGDACNDVVAAGTYGTGMIHLGDGAGNFDGGRDLPQLGYQNPATATRVTMAVGDLTGDGLPEVVIADKVNSAVMVYRNTSSREGALCVEAPPVDPGPSLPPPSSPSPSPSPSGRDCANPGTAPFAVGTPGDDVLVGTAGRDVLSGRGGDDCLFGRSGEDRLSGGSGADLLRGSSGSDRINGDAGNDKLDGSNGNDTITPGAGKDKVTAGGGNDEITARDGARDTIDCGAGRDKVTADRSDSVLGNCERVTRPTRRARRP